MVNCRSSRFEDVEFKISLTTSNIVLCGFAHYCLAYHCHSFGLSRIYLSWHYTQTWLISWEEIIRKSHIVDQTPSIECHLQSSLGLQQEYWRAPLMLLRLHRPGLIEQTCFQPRRMVIESFQRFYQRLFRRIHDECLALFQLLFRRVLILVNRPAGFNSMNICR